MIIKLPFSIAFQFIVTFIYIFIFERFADLVDRNEICGLNAPLILIGNLKPLFTRLLMFQFIMDFEENYYINSAQLNEFFNKEKRSKEKINILLRSKSIEMKYTSTTQSLLFRHLYFLLKLNDG